MAHHAHLRITPPGFDYDISGFLVEYPRHIVAREGGKITFKSHYHVWIETDACAKSIRNHVIKYFNIPKGKRGQTSAYYCLKYDAYAKPSPAYICKDLESAVSVISSGGYTSAEIGEFIVQGREQFKKPDPVEKPDLVLSSPVKKVSEFEGLLSSFEDYYYENSGFELIQSKVSKWICSYYLKQRKSIPRSSDISRWSYSIVKIVSDNVEPEQQSLI